MNYKAQCISIKGPSYNLSQTGRGGFSPSFTQSFPGSFTFHHKDSSLDVSITHLGRSYRTCRRTLIYSTAHLHSLPGYLFRSAFVYCWLYRTTRRALECQLGIITTFMSFGRWVSSVGVNFEFFFV